MRKVYLITGASSDLAIDFLNNLNRENDGSKDEYIIYGTYLENRSLLDENIPLWNNLNFNAVKCDLGELDGVEGLIERIKDDGEVPGYFIHLAATRFEYMRLSGFDWEKTRHELDVQVGSFGLICSWLIPKMSKMGFGRVIAVATAYTLGTPPKFMSDYIITKYALVGLVKAMAGEYAGRGVTVNAVSPGMMETKFLSMIDKRTVEINATNTAMKRNVRLNEVVEGMQYLLSDRAGYTNGINLNISGGDYM